MSSTVFAVSCFIGKPGGRCRIPDRPHTPAVTRGRAMNWRRAAAGHEIGQHLVIAGLGERARRWSTSRSGCSSRMDVLEELHVLTDDEEMKLLFVHHLEFLHGIARTRMQNLEAHRGFLPGLHQRGHGTGSRADNRERRRGAARTRSIPAARTLARHVHRVIGMHGANPGGFFVGSGTLLRLALKIRDSGGRGAEV